MTTVQEILRAADQLSPIEQLQIIQTLSQALQHRYPQAMPPRSPRSPRVFGLHAGEVTMSADFDAELPDSFWLGSDAAA